MTRALRFISTSTFVESFRRRFSERYFFVCQLLPCCHAWLYTIHWYSSVKRKQWNLWVPRPRPVVCAPGDVTSIAKKRRALIKERERERQREKKRAEYRRQQNAPLRNPDDHLTRSSSRNPSRANSIVRTATVFYGCHAFRTEGISSSKHPRFKQRVRRISEKNGYFLLKRETCIFMTYVYVDKNVVI